VYGELLLLNSSVGPLGGVCWERGVDFFAAFSFDYEAAHRQVRRAICWFVTYLVSVVEPRPEVGV